jgi:mannose-1-phosphate guanylyltransferase
MKIVNVVLSGGVGSRLWPLSRKSRPKQYLPLFHDESLFEKTIKRNLELCNQLMVVGGVDNYLLSREILHKTGQRDYHELVEATPRNTAAAIAFAALSLKPEDIMLVTPSDHLIGDQKKYKEAVDNALILAKNGFLVTFGLVPTKPETGFGYIEHKGNDVVAFWEKPGMEMAKEFLKEGNFLWNSGMFCFSAGTYLSELETFEPSVLSSSKDAWKAAQNGFLPLELSRRIPSISVDYAVMERSKKIKVVPSAFNWSDMGSFEALYDYFPGDSPEKKGSNMVLGTSKQVEFVGTDHIILVETNDAILVLNKSHAQEVKKVYERLEKENPGLLS